MIRSKSLSIVIIVFIAFFLRLYGINWDSGQHLHPDERFLTMVGVASRIPVSLGEYLDPRISPLNPYNNNFSFFIYGTLPLTITKIVAVFLRLDSYTYLTLVGRALSAIFDTATVLLVFLIARMFEKRYKLSPAAKYLAAFLYAIAVLPIQQSHFFTVDSFATFFTTAVAYCALRYYYDPKKKYAALAAVSLGFALGAKLSSLYVGPLALALIVFAPAQSRIFRQKTIAVSIFVIVAYVVFHLSDPHAWATGNLFDPRPSPQFVGNVRQLADLSETSAWYPPGLQWIGKTRLLFPLKNIMFAGLGPVYFLVAVLGFGGLVRSVFESGIRDVFAKRELLFFLGWVVGVLVYQGLQPVMSIRYFYLLYPYCALFAGVVLSRLSRRWVLILLFFILLWPISFMAIYTRPHTRVAASGWIYQHIPAGSVIATEHWDDGLPLSLSSDHVSQQYTIEQLPVFDQDTQEKWRSMNDILSRSDYLIFSSNRGYGSIMPHKERYPQMSMFYADLFAGRLPFKKVAEFTSYPTFPLYYILHTTYFVFPDQWTDEAFTVYDHPKVMIFQKCKDSC